MEMTPKPLLRYKTETVHRVKVDDLETFIEAVTGHYYNCVLNEEWYNDSHHRFEVNGEMCDWEKESWDVFKKTGEQWSFCLPVILKGLVKDGRLKAGVYVITVSW
jgi:hypothetical protein